MILYLFSIPCSFPKLPPLEGLSSLNEADELNLSTYVFLQCLGNILNQESVWLSLQAEVLLVGMLFSPATWLAKHFDFTSWGDKLPPRSPSHSSSAFSVFSMFALFWFRSGTKTTPRHLADLTCHRHLSYYPCYVTDLLSHPDLPDVPQAVRKPWSLVWGLWSHSLAVLHGKSLPATFRYDVSLRFLFTASKLSLRMHTVCVAPCIYRFSK